MNKTNRKLIILVFIAISLTMLIGGSLLFSQASENAFFVKSSCFWIKQIYALVVLWSFGIFCLFYRPKNTKYMIGAIPILYSTHFYTHVL